jgi:hypothetical protein
MRVVFTGAMPLPPDAPAAQEETPGLRLQLQFRPERRRADVDRIDTEAAIGPQLDIPSVAGLGKVVRILRAARIAHPSDIEELAGREDQLLDLLRRAVGTSLAVELRPRSRMRFTAWTESGVETVDDVTEVLEAPDAYLVMRRSGRFPVRVPRENVVRQQTELERWYEVTDIERA